MKIVEALGLSAPCVAAVVGCGGKTSFIERAACFLREKGEKGKKILVAPTTKMYPMDLGGVDCLGALNPETGKLEALPQDELAALVPLYDVALLEADGSNGLPLKGWRPDEPVVPKYCTHTVGIVTLKALGLPAAGGAVHCLPEFLSLTGLREGEIVTLEALEAMVCAPLGMFKNSAGSCSLFVNQVEDWQAVGLARSFLGNIKRKYPGRFARLLYGSVRYDECQRV